MPVRQQVLRRSDVFAVGTAAVARHEYPPFYGLIGFKPAFGLILFIHRQLLGIYFTSNYCEDILTVLEVVAIQITVQEKQRQTRLVSTVRDNDTTKR